jgi:hypothetical protein
MAHPSSGSFTSNSQLLKGLSDLKGALQMAVTALSGLQAEMADQRKRLEDVIVRVLLLEAQPLTSGEEQSVRQFATEEERLSMIMEAQRNMFERLDLMEARQNELYLQLSVKAKDKEEEFS